MNTYELKYKTYEAVMIELLKEIDKLYICPLCESNYISQLMLQREHSISRKQLRKRRRVVKNDYPEEKIIIELINSSHDDIEKLYQQCIGKNCEGVNNIAKNYVSRVARLSGYYLQNSGIKNIKSVLNNKDLLTSFDCALLEEKNLLLDKSLA